MITEANRQFTIGKTPDDRLDNVEFFMRQIARRMNRVCEVYIPPIPISSYSTVEEDGVFFRYVFPIKGRIENCVMIFGGLSCTVEVLFISAKESRSTEKGVESGVPFDLDIDVNPGDRIILTALSQISQVWVGIPYYVEPNQARIETVLIDKLERMVKDAKTKEG